MPAGARIAECPDQIAYLILDATGFARALPTAIAPIQAESIAALAVTLGIEPLALEATVDEFNAAAASSEGLPLKERRTKRADPAEIPRRGRPSPKPPYVAYPLRPGITFTHYGVTVDAEMRVVKMDGIPMGNVFAAGMVMAANVLGDGYLAGLGVSLSTGIRTPCRRESRAAGTWHRHLNIAQAASSRRHPASSAGSPNR